MSSLTGGARVMATAGDAGQLAPHLMELHGLRASAALAGARQSPGCDLCETWLRRQLEGLGKERV